MPKRVTLDAMIPREDFGLEGDEYELDLFDKFPIWSLAKDSPHQRLLRKPDFQRETNHWSPEQLATFIASFVDNEIIPSLILWKSPKYIFVIDGGHRLSALRAWMEDDYGDRAISTEFYGGEIPDDQKRIARKARAAVEAKVGRFSTLKDLVGNKSASPEQLVRANRLVTRTIPVQWIQGSADVAETSFFKVNSQGTPLDDTEEMLIRNRRKPVAICARAVLRAGAGHKYWSDFDDHNQARLEQLAAEFYRVLFQPEVDEPLRTLELPLGGSVSPVDALSLLIEFITITGSREATPKSIEKYADDAAGDETIRVLENSLQVVNRFTGNSPESLGLHPAVYFYNERGKYSRFMFLAMSALITEKLRNNDGAFFRKFTQARASLEKFLLDNRSLLGIVLQNMSKGQRVPKLRDLLVYLISEFHANRQVSAEAAIQHLGLRGRIIDVVAQPPPQFTDDTKSVIYIRQALAKALTCPMCSGVLDPNKSVSYDHKQRVQDGGLGHPDNGQLTHPYCNSGYREWMEHRNRVNPGDASV